MSDIDTIAKGMCSIDMCLYEAEEIIKLSVIDEYGISYYEKYGEGIHAMIEEVYNDKIRSTHPLIINSNINGSMMY